MNQPTLPAIGIHKDDYIFGILTDETNIIPKKSALLGYLKHRKGDALYFDKLGRKWCLHYANPKPHYKKNWWNTFLANTLFNPEIELDIEWEVIGNYQFRELRQAVSKCIEKDDDILTQYVEYEVLLNKVAQTTQFMELINVLNKYVFEVDEEELAKELD